VRYRTTVKQLQRITENQSVNKYIDPNQCSNSNNHIWN